MLPPLAELREVSKHYRAPGWRGGRAWALSGVSMAVAPGEVIGLLGPNRSGKSTVLRLLLGLSRPSAGTCWRFGRPSRDSGTLGRVGYVRERPALPPERSPRAMLRLLGALSGVSPGALGAKVERALAEAGLESVAGRPLGVLSRGTQQRLALAQALLHEPDLLLLDEAFSGLDPDGAWWLSQQIALWSDAGRSVLFVSHDLGLIQRLATRVVVLDAGRPRFDGLPTDWSGNELSAREEVGA